MKLQEKINAAAQKVTDTKEGTPERYKAEAELELLKNGLKDVDDLFDQDAVNGFVAKEKGNVGDLKGRIEKMFGTEIDKVEGVLAQFETMLTDDNAGGDDDTSGAGAAAGAGAGAGGSGNVDANTVLGRMQSELSKRDQTIKTLQEGHTGFQRSYYTKELNDGLADGFRNMGLDPNFEASANAYLENVVGISDLVDKRMKGEEVDKEEIKAKLDAVHQASPVWFQPVVNPDLPNVPVTPDGQPPKTLTDEERAQASNASGGQVF